MNKSNIENVIEQYLTMTTNYAVLVNGKRGMGKTYLVKNQVADLIKNTATLHDVSSNYKFLYISLYGLKSIDEVYSLMALELYPVIKKMTQSKEVKLGIGIAKILTRGLLNLNGLGGFDEYMKDIQETGKNLLDAKGFVFVFDDLDRKNSDLDINSLIGFVNSLVEHDNNKVILIADSEIIDDERYREVKEKTIGVVIDYVSDFSEIFDQIASGYEKRGFKRFHSFLQNFKEELTSPFKNKKNFNLRILIFLLEHIFVVFGDVYDDLNLDKNPDENSLEIKKLRNAVKFSTAISIEFRMGHISFQKRQQIDEAGELGNIMNRETMEIFWKSEFNESKEKETDQKSYFEGFLEDYFPRHDYHFYSSIFDFITGGSNFKKTNLLAEFKIYYDDRLQTVSPQSVVQNELHINNCLGLSNSELKSKTRQMLKYAFNGEYTLDTYLSVFYYVHRFNHIFRYDMKFLAKKLIHAISKYRNKFAYSPMFSHQFGIETDRENYAEYLAIFKAANKINELANADKTSTKSNDLFIMFVNDRTAFYKKIENNPEGELNLASWNAHKTFHIIKKMRGDEILEFRSFVSRFHSKFRKRDLNFLEALLNKFSTIKATNNLKFYSLDLLKTKLESAVGHVKMYGY
jgi:hypothetical protein